LKEEREREREYILKLLKTEAEFWDLLLHKAKHGFWIAFEEDTPIVLRGAENDAVVLGSNGLKSESYHRFIVLIQSTGDAESRVPFVSEGRVHVRSSVFSF
jgi:hypothetical protein